MDILAFSALTVFLWVSHCFYAHNTTPIKLIKENVHSGKPIKCPDQLFHLNCDY